MHEEFIKEFHKSMETKDHCPCKRDCKYHGKCTDCVAIHKNIKKYLPCCLRKMTKKTLK